MKIENRVEALELELKILKNEIQSTLLEIREQILNHYYPELRADDSDRPISRSPQAHNGSGRVKPTPPAAAAKPVTRNGDGAQKPAFSDIFLQDLGIDADELDDEPEDEPLPPVIQRLGRALTRVAVDDAPVWEDDDDVPSPRTREAAPTVKNVIKPARRPFAALAAWVGESVAKVGKVRTLQIIETYAAGAGLLNAETEGRLRQLVALANDEEPQTTAGSQDMMALLVGLDEILAE